MGESSADLVARVEKILSVDVSAASDKDIDQALAEAAEIIAPLENDKTLQEHSEKLRVFCEKLVVCRKMLIPQGSDSDDDLLVDSFEVLSAPDEPKNNPLDLELDMPLIEDISGGVHLSKQLAKEFLEQFQQLMEHDRTNIGRLSRSGASKGSLPTLDAIKRILVRLTDASKQFFWISIAGEGKTGKSTFINALLGQEILKADLLPCTGNVCTLSYGTKYSAHVQDSRGRWTSIPIRPDQKIDDVLAPYTRMKQLSASDDDVTEYTNVNVKLPSDILKERISFKDLPGLNQRDANTTSAIEALNKSHAVIWVTDARKPLTHIEQKTIKWLREKLNHDRIFIVANRFDQITGKILPDDPEFTKEEIDEDLAESRKRLEEELLKQVEEYLPAVYERRSTMIHFTSSKHALVNKKRIQENRKCVPEPGTGFARLENCLTQEILRQREVFILGPICNQLENYIKQLVNYVELQLKIASHNIGERKAKLAELENKLKEAKTKYDQLKEDSSTLSNFIEDRASQVLLSIDKWHNSTRSSLAKIITDWNPKETENLEREAKRLATDMNEHVSKTLEQLRCILLKRVDEERENLLKDFRKYLEQVVDCVNMIAGREDQLNTLIDGPDQLTIQPIDAEQGSYSSLMYGAFGGGAGAAAGVGGAIYIGASALFPPAAVAGVVGALLFGVVAYLKRPTWDQTVAAIKEKQSQLVVTELKTVNDSLQNVTKKRLLIHYGMASNVLLNSLQDAITSLEDQIAEIKADTRSKQQIEDTFRKFDQPLRLLYDRIRALIESFQQKAKC